MSHGNGTTELRQGLPHRLSPLWYPQIQPPESPMPIDILQTGKLHATCEAALAERYTVHKLHEAADRDAFLAEVAPRIRAHAGSGVQADLIGKLPRLEIIAGFGVGTDSI